MKLKWKEEGKSRERIEEGIKYGIKYENGYGREHMRADTGENAQYSKLL